MTAAATINKPTLNRGIFLARDVADILVLPYPKVRRWMIEFWDTRFGQEAGNKYTFGEDGNKAVDFYTLIEFYVFYQLRNRKISSQKIQKFHSTIAKELKTPFPFAHSKIRTDGKKVWYDYFESIISADGKQQLDFREILEPFLERIEFGDNNIAERYFPLANSKNVVVDPKHQFGQPTIKGTNIRTETIYKLIEGGENEETVSKLYHISPQKVADAILYYKRSA